VKERKTVFIGSKRSGKKEIWEKVGVVFSWLSFYCLVSRDWVVLRLLHIYISFIHVCVV